jgi:hypothetical protein
MTQAQVAAAVKGGLTAGAKCVTIEATLPDGTKLKVTARAEQREEIAAQEGTSNPWDEVLDDGRN